MRMEACDKCGLLPLKEHLCHCCKSQILRLKLLTSETKNYQILIKEVFLKVCFTD